jgi:hypothetical protein
MEEDLGQAHAALEQIAELESGSSLETRLASQVNPPVNGVPVTLIPSPPGRVEVQWYRGFKGSVFQPIEGATGLKYTPTADDIGAVLMAKASMDGVSASSEIGPIECQPETLRRVMDHLGSKKGAVLEVASVGAVQAGAPPKSIVLTKQKIKIRGGKVSLMKEVLSSHLTVELDPNDKDKFLVQINDKDFKCPYKVTEPGQRDLYALTIRLYNDLAVHQRDTAKAEAEAAVKYNIVQHNISKQKGQNQDSQALLLLRNAMDGSSVRPGELARRVSISISQSQPGIGRPTRARGNSAFSVATPAKNVDNYSKSIYERGSAKPVLADGASSVSTPSKTVVKAGRGKKDKDKASKSEENLSNEKSSSSPAIGKLQVEVKAEVATPKTPKAQPKLEVSDKRKEIEEDMAATPSAPSGEVRYDADGFNINEEQQRGFTSYAVGNDSDSDGDEEKKYKVDIRDAATALPTSYQGTAILAPPGSVSPSPKPKVKKDKGEGAKEARKKARKEAKKQAKRDKAKSVDAEELKDTKTPDEDEDKLPESEIAQDFVAPKDSPVAGAAEAPIPESPDAVDSVWGEDLPVDDVSTAAEDLADDVPTPAITTAPATPVAAAAIPGSATSTSTTTTTTSPTATATATATSVTTSPAAATTIANSSAGSVDAVVCETINVRMVGGTIESFAVRGEINIVASPAPTADSSFLFSLTSQERLRKLVPNAECVEETAEGGFVATLTGGSCCLAKYVVDSDLSSAAREVPPYTFLLQCVIFSF